MTDSNAQSPTPPADSERLTLLHFGDLHVWRFGWDVGLSPKPLLGLTNLAFKRARAFPRTVLDAVVERLAGETVDHMLFTGDLTTASLPREFEAATTLLKPLMQRWEGRFHCIPGNHDRYTPRSTRKSYFEKLFLGRAQTYPFTVELNRHWALTGFDCTLPRFFTSRGHMNPHRLAQLEAELAREELQGRRLILMGHYPLVYPPAMHVAWEHALPERERLQELFMRHKVRLYLHGHKHNRWLLRTGEMLHLNCGSAGMAGPTSERRPGYVKIYLRGAGIERIEACVMAAEMDPQRPAGVRWESVTLEPGNCAP